MENSLNFIERPHHRKKKRKKEGKNEGMNNKQIDKNLGTFRASKMAQ